MAESAWLNFYCGVDKQARIATFRLTGGEWQLAEVAAETMPEGGAIPGRIPMTGQFGVADDYPGCPACKARQYVRCGGCGNLSCWNDTSKKFTCGNCRISGPVSGSIQSLDAMDMA